MLSAKRLSFVAGLLLAVVGAAGCGINIQNPLGGSCRGTQSFQGMSVNVCTENPSARVDQQTTLNAACRSGAIGSTGNDWRMGEACPAEGRVGGCAGTVMGISVTTWVYENGTPFITSETISMSCPSGTTYVAP